ncbi:MAG: triose-phosphate isomerase [Alphaproteobacteria bacterium]|nr:triose-phosphate isomerase [Alphaproteobacteria bacterium]
MKKIKPLIAGNWKMNGITRKIGEVRKMSRALSHSSPHCDVMICAPATLLSRLSGKKGKIILGGQDCHAAENGAHTGDISVAMLKDAGAKAVIVGHSERRTDHNETSKQVCAKAAAAHKGGLVAIICVGESLAERKAGKTLAIIRQQLKASLPVSCTAKNTTIAYEPIWAIGTGLTPTEEQVARVHKAIRTTITKRFGGDGGEGEAMRLLYGGSVKPSNAKSLLAVPNVNGALVGGASLTASDFLKIIDTFRKGSK